MDLRNALLEALQRFAHGLREDYAAVPAGVTLPWSSGPVEGPINRLTLLKRQRFGRARLDRVRCRFMSAPRTRRRTRPPLPRQRRPRRCARARPWVWGILSQGAS